MNSDEKAITSSKDRRDVDFEEPVKEGTVMEEKLVVVMASGDKARDKFSPEPEVDDGGGWCRGKCQYLCWAAL